MKHKLFYASVLVLIMFSALLCGCDEQPIPPPQGSFGPTTVPPTTAPPELVFESSYCVFAEPYGNIYDSKRSFKTAYNGVTYHFTTSIDDAERTAAVAECDTLISVLLENHPDYRQELTVCVRHDDYPVRVVDHTLYIGITRFGTQELAVGLSWMVFGQHVNYGLVYAHGTKAAQQMGYETDAPEMPLSEALTVPRCYLDMTYPCFLPEYADETTMSKVKALAMHFYLGLVQKDRLDLLSDYSDSKYSQYLTDFLTANGQEGYDNADLGNTIFYNGGPAMRLVWENEDAIFYIEKDFSVYYQESQFAEDMLGSGYENLRQLVVDYQLQADYIEELLGYCEDENGRVDVIFTKRHPSEMYTAGQYTAFYNTIEMFAAGPYLHEYTHYLLRDTPIHSWMNELLCYYYGYNPVNEQLSYQWDDQVTRITNLSIADPSEEAEAYLISKLEDHLGRDIDWDDPDDFAYIFSAYVVVTNGYDSLTNPYGGAQSKLSFMRYLINQVGEEAALKAVTENKPIETFGKDWPTLIAEWEAGLRAEYAWLRKYFIF